MSDALLRFDTFELDRGNFQLRCSGRSVHLQKVPLELLILLAEKEGCLVTRADIIERIWGKDVFVDVDSAVNTAIRKIRIALGDDAEETEYVETVPGEGYRFVTQVPPHAEELQIGGKDSSLIQPLIAVLPLDDLSDDAADYFSEA